MALAPSSTVPLDYRPSKRVKRPAVDDEKVQAAIQVLWGRVFDGGQRRIAGRIQRHICPTSGRLTKDVVVHACVGRGKTTLTAVPFLHAMYMYRNGFITCKPRALVICEAPKGPSLERFYKELGFRTLRIDGFDPLTPEHKSVPFKNRNFWKDMSPADLTNLDVLILPESMNLSLQGVPAENASVLRKAWSIVYPYPGYERQSRQVGMFFERLLNQYVSSGRSTIKSLSGTMQAF